MDDLLLWAVMSVVYGLSYFIRGLTRLYRQRRSGMTGPSWWVLITDSRLYDYTGRCLAASMAALVGIHIVDPAFDDRPSDAPQ